MEKKLFEGALHATLYSKFRPNPPANLISFIISYLQEKYAGPLNLALDVGCGSGQSTRLLSPYFKRVIGSDISEAQIANAKQDTQASNISYILKTASSLEAEDTSVQLITACQAAHWFDLPQFFQEANRVLVPHGVLALMGYVLPCPFNPTAPDDRAAFMDVVDQIYHTTGPWWDSSRVDVDREYDRITLPYPDALYMRGKDSEQFTATVNGTVEEFLGYLQTWSGLQAYIKDRGQAECNKLLLHARLRLLDLLGQQEAGGSAALNWSFRYFLLISTKPKES
ncbi:unnamed protein product [Darwinula stevensoni]|uniref:Methyltransferase type 11 domain-containing protein n=1 Tax=Darwinula stevensoni TaxID=69355 RepID=A0A7R9A5T1_9CRUS|nr:unnamed protein product [Darwinula stevensoni]CAG0895050.1 unnamed protein product [Darwinula stevensoni]